MATVKMKKMTVYGLKSEKQDVMYLLQRMGVMEITEMEDLAPEDRCKKEVKPEVVNAQKKIGEIDSAILSIKNSLGKKAKLPKPQCGLADINNAGKDVEKLEALLGEVNAMATEVQDGKNEIARLENLISGLQVYKNMTIPMESIGETEFTTSFVGKIATENLAKLNEVTAGLGCNIDVVYQDKADAYFLLLAENSEIAGVVQEMRKLSYTKVDLGAFKDVAGLPKDIIAESEAKVAELKAGVEANTAKLAGYEKDVEFLMLSYEFYNIMVQQEENTKYGAETETAFVVEGWVRAKDVDAIQKSIANLTPNAYAAVREPYENEKAPTALSNPGIIKPFEVVTDLYSAPKSNGFDPNFIMAPFYFIFFGMMFGDVGYGLILTIAAFAFMKVAKPEGKMISKLVKLIAICGIASAIWGALCGSYFAIDSAVIEKWGIPSIFNPMMDPIPVLIVGYALGLVHLFTGNFLGAYLAFKDGDIAGALFDNIAWVVTELGLTIWLVAFIGPTMGYNVPSAVLNPIGMWMSIIGAVTLVLTQGRAKKGIFGKITKGILSLYDLTGFLSDVLSYSRLFALGLSGAVIGLVFNLLAGMMFGNVITIPVGIILLAIGHVFNIALSVLGAYVHASRLQYIEFYGKFYDGGGSEFNPLGLQTKYVKLS